MIVRAIPTYLSNAFPPSVGLSGCGFGDAAECDPTSDFYDSINCALDYPVQGSTGTTTLPTLPTTTPTQPVNVTINNPSQTPVAATPTSSWDSFLMQLGLVAAAPIAKAGATAISASSLPAGYSLINNPNGTQSIVSPQGVSTLVGSSSSSLTTSLNSLLPFLLIGGSLFLVFTVAKK